MTLVDTFPEFVNAVDEWHFGTTKALGWRAGQTAFNLLSKVRPDLAAMVRGSDFDPFNDDGNLVAFFSFACRHWDDDKP